MLPTEGAIAFFSNWSASAVEGIKQGDDESYVVRQNSQTFHRCPNWGCIRHVQTSLEKEGKAGQQAVLRTFLPGHYLLSDEVCVLSKPFAPVLDLCYWMSELLLLLGEYQRCMACLPPPPQNPAASAPPFAAPATTASCSLHELLLVLQISSSTRHVWTSMASSPSSRHRESGSWMMRVSGARCRGDSGLDADASSRAPWAPWAPWRAYP